MFYSPFKCHAKTQLEIAAASLAAGLAGLERPPSLARGTTKSLVPTNELQLLPVAAPAPRRVEIAAVHSLQLSLLLADPGKQGLLLMTSLKIATFRNKNLKCVGKPGQRRLVIARSL